MTKISHSRLCGHLSSRGLTAGSRLCESGQALIGGLFFLILATSASFYFIFVFKSVRELYADTLSKRFEKIAEATKYAHILNEIAVNNQNIIASLMTTQVSYVSAIENGLTISYQQPYWQTYSNFQNKNNKSALTEDSQSTIEKSFEAEGLSTARGLFVAQALTVKNKELVGELPLEWQIFFSQMSNGAVHCLALEFLKNELDNSNYVRFLVPNIYQFGVTKKNCTLQHKTNFLQSLMSTGLSVLSTNESDFIIAFNKIDDYSNFGSEFSFGMTYVKPETAAEFIQILKFETTGTLKSVIRISHPQFVCKNSFSDASHLSNFTIEEDWKHPCEIDSSSFLKSFLKPNWAALVTHQDKGLKVK